MQKLKRPVLTVQGKPDSNFPLPHEMRVLFFLRDYYHTDITSLAPSRKQGEKTPDLEMMGLLWEVKSPKGTGKYTIERCIKVAA